MISSAQTNRDERSANALRDVLNAFGTIAARERHRLHQRERRVRDGRQLLAVRCEKCDTRVAAIYHTSLGRLLVPYGDVILYRLPTPDAVAPDLPQRLHERPGVTPDLAAHVFGYVREYLTEGSAPPVEDDYRRFLANVGKWMRDQPILCRCHCAGPSLHELAAPRMLDAIGVKSAIGVSAVATPAV
ncbi:MAG: hypothetical protein ACRDSH_19105 [Pseudonocardiaceae bacterium]